MKTVEYGKTELTPSIFSERANVNASYLKELKNHALLQNFYWEAGIIIPGTQVVNDPHAHGLHWGWEAPCCQLRGHFLGHWMSASSVLLSQKDDTDLRSKLVYIVNELERCQKMNGGKWIGSIPEKYFEIMKTDTYIWSPQYTMHKTIMGLLHAYKFARIEKAGTILSNLADWYTSWTDRMLKECPAAIYRGEMGGMLEIWADCYDTFKDKKYLDLAEKYSHTDMFNALLEGKDPLSNIHTNATIPWSHGAAKMYGVTGDEKWKNVVLAFWKCAVTDRDMLATTGNNAGEYWIPPHKMGSFISDRDQEFCTVYNMVRTANYLLQWTGDSKYADYIERALYNGFLAQQNKFTGMPDYFLSLVPGSHKEWGSKTADFWCCHGTTVQAHTIYPSLIWYYNKENEKLSDVSLAQYIPSKVNFTSNDNNITLSVATNMHYNYDQTFFSEKDSERASRWQFSIKVKADKQERFTLKLRLPEWTNGKAEITFGEKEEKLNAKDGWIILDREWKDEEFIIQLGAKVTLKDLPGNEDLACIMEGPIVMAGLIDADVGLKGSSNPEKMLFAQTEHMYSTYPWKQSTYITKGQDKNFSVIPLYEVTDEKYTVYFTKK